MFERNEGSARRPVILVVDDDEDARDLLVEYLGFRGQRVVRAANVAQARLVLEHVAVDTVVTDYSMPGEDGVSLVRWIRSYPAGHRIAIVLATGHELDRDLHHDLRRLRAGFIAKPLDLERLLAELAKARLLVDDSRRAEPAKLACDESRRGG